jgi:sugar lactone lactonase YvrE
MGSSRRSSWLRRGTLARFLCALLLSLVVAGVAAAEVAAPEWVRAQYVPDKNIIGLAWKVVPGATSYQVLKSTTAGSGYQVLATVPNAMFVDKTAEPGESYYYVLKALAGKEESPLEMGKKKAVVALVWNRPAATNVVTFNIYKKGPGDADFQVLAAVNDTKFSDEAVEIGKSYEYALSSVDDSFTETERSEARKVDVKDVETKKVVKDKFNLVARWTETVRRHKGGDPIAPDSKVAIDIIEPFDVVVDAKKGLVFISSTNTKRIVVVTTEGKFVRYIGRDGALTEDGVLNYPVGIAIDSEGRIYVCDGKRNDVQLFDSEGKFLAKFLPQRDEQTKEPPVPKDIAVAPDGTIYLLDYQNSQVQVFDKERKFKFKFSKVGSDPGDLRYPNYMEVAKDGSRIFVVNTGNSKVVAFDKQGKFVGQWGGKKNDVGKFVFIAGIAVDKKNQVYISDLNTSFVQVFNSSGQYLFSLGNEKGDGAADLFVPRGMYVGDDDRIYATEGMVGRVSILQMKDTYTPATWEPQGAEFAE